MRSSRKSEETPQTSESPAPTVADVLLSISAEIERVEELARRIERSLCDAASDGEIESRSPAELQELDMVIQSLAAIREFASVTAQASTLSARLDIEPALQLMRLAGMRARLSGSIGEEMESGEPEFF